MVLIRSAYSARKRKGITFDKTSRTKQSMKDDVNINLIMARYAKTGTLTHVNELQGFYGEFHEVTDYQTALNLINEADDSFSELPAKIRAMFENDPQQLVEFVQDDKNYEKALDLGLISQDAAKAYLEAKDAQDAERKDNQQALFKDQLEIANAVTETKKV